MPCRNQISLRCLGKSGKLPKPYETSQSSIRPEFYIEPWQIYWENIDMTISKASNTLLLEPGMEDMYKCVHCGLCLSACPTYLTTGREMESPRGRIALMQAVKENRIEPSSRVISHWEACLQCRGCETAWPSGVPFGFLMEQTKAELIYPQKTSLKQRF